jgi:hypothetical protein
VLYSERNPIRPAKLRADDASTDWLEMAKSTKLLQNILSTSRYDELLECAVVSLYLTHLDLLIVLRNESGPGYERRVSRCLGVERLVFQGQEDGSCFDMKGFVGMFVHFRGELLSFMEYSIIVRNESIHEKFGNDIYRVNFDENALPIAAATVNRWKQCVAVSLSPLLVM